MKGIQILLFTFIIGFIGLINVNAEVCSYNYDGYTLNVTVSDSNLNFSFSGMSVKYKKMSEVNGKISLTDSNANSLTILSSSDFINSDGDVDCDKVKNITIDANTTNNSVVEVYYIGKNTSCNISKKVLTAYPNNYIPSTSGNPLPDCAKFSLSSSNNDDEENGFTSGEQTSGNDGVDGEEAISGDWNVATFCEGPVQGVFTTMGWVFFILKIVIPIVLIVMGSIDLAKAVVASKDDEIKKAVSSLVKRAVLGILIFFIPTILSFVVELIGGDNIYDEDSGTFGRCTYCMLNPSECRKLAE